MLGAFVLFGGPSGTGSASIVGACERRGEKAGLDQLVEVVDDRRTVDLAITVVALALVVARRPVGWVAGAVVTGAFLSLLGAGSLTLSPIPSSLGTVGGWAAVLGGVTFAVVARIAARSAPRSTA